MRLSRFSAMTMPPATGSEPPDRLVPLPRATKGSRFVVAEPHERDHFVRRLRNRHRQRTRAKGRQPVAFISSQMLRPLQQPPRRHQRREALEDGGGHG